MAGGEGSPTRCSAENAASAAGAEAAASAAAGGKNRLSVRWILAQTPKPPPPRYQALKRSNPELTPRPGEEDDREKLSLYRVARAFYEREERLPRLQERVRGELKSKGYVEVDEDYHKRKAEMQAVIDREWAKIVARFKHLGIESDTDTDSDEEEEDEEQEEET